MHFRNRGIAAAMLALVSLSAYADEDNAGVVHFTGEIIDPSCRIEGDNGTDSTVPLGTYPTSLFSTVGTESPLTPFSIILADCPLTSTGLPAVQLTFNGATALTKSTTLLDVSKLTTSGDAAATGVGIAVSPEGADTNHLKMDGTDGLVYITLPTIKNDTIQANFNARYKSFTDKVTAGAADADMTVNILYR